MRWRIVLAAMLLHVAFAAPLTVRADGQAVSLQGRVSGGGRPLAGVCVSDGRRVVRTDSGGEYRLPVDEESGRFVFRTES